MATDCAAVNPMHNCPGRAEHSQELEVHMPRLVWIVGATLCGYLGWLLGERFGMMTAYGFSVVGSAIGIYLSFKLWQRFFR